MGTTVVGGQSETDYLSAYNHREYAQHKFYITTEHMYSCEVPYDGASGPSLFGTKRGIGS
jgi:hypothetical protein